MLEVGNILNMKSLGIQILSWYRSYFLIVLSSKYSVKIFIMHVFEISTFLSVLVVVTMAYDDSLDSGKHEFHQRIRKCFMFFYIDCIIFAFI